MRPVRTIVAERRPAVPKGEEVGLCAPQMGGWKTPSWFSVHYGHLVLVVAEDLVFAPSAPSNLLQVLADTTCSRRRGNVPLNSCQSELELM